jgi:hypothetical protein
MISVGSQEFPSNETAVDIDHISTINRLRLPKRRREIEGEMDNIVWKEFIHTRIKF